MTQRSAVPGSGSRRPGFTVIELMIVMVVIALVISILLPALGGVRNAARKTSTQGLLNQIIAAAQKFSVDKKRQPGYFGPREMGSVQNESAGLSAMENVMLDLAGGIVATGGGAGVQPPNTLTINPTGDPNRDVYVDLEKIGQAGAYYSPPKNFFVAQTYDAADACQQFTTSPAPALGHTGSSSEPTLPDIVDGWGSPLLAWVEDPASLAPVNPTGTPSVLLVRRNFVAPNQSARFYLASNAAFLRASMLGKKARQQTWRSADEPRSMIGYTASGAGVTAASHDAMRSLEAVVGSPNYAWKDATGQSPHPMHPASSRAPFIVHSAGPDGYYFGSSDKNGRKASGVLDYTLTFWTDFGQTTRNTDKNGKPTNEDVARGFDDVMATSAN